VDVERVVPGVAEEVVRHFAPGALDHYQALPPGLRQRIFFRGWTRMEAFAKGRGTGLQPCLEDLHRFLGAVRNLRSNPGGTEEASHWSVHDLRPRRGYVGALVSDRQKCRLRYWRCST
jgi:phosphopantetheinyl transferase